MNDESELYCRPEAYYLSGVIIQILNYVQLNTMNVTPHSVTNGKLTFAPMIDLTHSIFLVRIQFNRN